ncbi:MAG: hypothetical protein QOK40_914 [Miltoncostaeaceae bacterium]|jgi:hypothetical protein|nr:hypothetical protein [Miltoncostaeaceae bacterium]
MAGLGALVALMATPAGNDAAAHLYETGLWSAHGWRFWDNFWYAGRYSQINYSLLYYPLAALCGTVTVVAGSVAVAAGAFCQLMRGRWPALATGPALAFSLLAPLAVLAGAYPFLLGLALALAALAALQAGRTRIAVLLVAATAAAHPLALVFLLCVLIALAGSRRGWWRRAREVRFALAATLIVAVAALGVRAFGGADGRYPFDRRDALAIAVFCASGLWLTRGLADQRVLRALFITYAIVSAAAFALASPLGGNLVRLTTLAGAPLLLLPVTARGFRPRALTAVLLAAALCWQALPALAHLNRSADARAADERFWYPVEAFLDRHRDPNYRVEVVATYGHWEALYLARRGVALARGWYRQDDFPENAALYRPLTARGYDAWLRRLAVHYVLLPDDPLDPSAEAEAARVRAGTGLDLVARLAGWRIYALPHPTPIATPAREIRVVAVSAERIALRVRQPRRYELRLRYTPYWEVSGPACAAPGRPWGTDLRVARSGLVILRFAPEFGSMLGALLGRQPGCS